MNQRTITESNLKAAANLRRIWDGLKRERKLTQVAASHDLGWSSAMVGQHLNGHVALNVEAILKYAGYLGVSPYDIAKDFDDILNVPTPFLLRDDLEIRLNQTVRSANAKDQEFIAEFLDRFRPFDPPNNDAPASPRSSRKGRKTKRSAAP